MRCPICKISSMEPVDSGGTEIDRCGSCGAIWFDPGEIRELTEGRLSPPATEVGKFASDAGTDQAGVTGTVSAGGPGRQRNRFPIPSPMLEMHRLAATLCCPRCDAPLSALDYQATGVPVIVCSACRGFLLPRSTATTLAERFAFSRVHAAKYSAMGESMAAEIKRQLDLKYFAAGNPEFTAKPSFGIPVVVPLSCEAPAARSFPAATWTFMVVPVIFLILSAIGGAPCRLPWSPGGLPSGAGFPGISFWSLLAYPFLPGGLLPLGTGVLFLFVLGRQVEERVGLLPFAGIYLLGAIISGVVHMMAGRIGAPVALGSSGAVAAVLGAYLVFFPNVAITMYGMGRVVSAPAYLFACCWVVATLMANPETGGITGFLFRIVDPTPLSLWGSLAGFLSGMLLGVARRSHEDRFMKRY